MRRASRGVSTIRMAVAFAAVAAMSSVALASAPAGAITASRTYYVGTTVDNVTPQTEATCERPTNKVCSLRTDIGLAVADGSGYTITIEFATPKGVPLTLNPNNGALNVTGGENLTIDGQGAGNTFISGGNKTQVFYTSQEYLTIENLTIENGWGNVDGAGLENDYNLTLNNVNFTNDNSVFGSDGGGAIYSDYDLTVNGGTYSHNNADDCGGAMYLHDDATVSHVSFLDNSSDCGGAVYTDESGDYTLSDDLYVSNSSRDYDDGGAMELEGDVLVENSTFTRNVSSEYGGAIGAESSSDTEIFNNTIVDNWALFGGGGVSTDRGTMDMSGNILTGNTEIDGGPGSGVLGQCVDYGNVFTDGGGNVIGPDNDPDCGFHASTDRLNANVKLGPLQNNGGATETMAITDTSVAADVVPSGQCPATDQRGQPRGGDCSAGAYQVEPTGSATTCKSLTGSAETTITFKSCTNKGSSNTSVGGSGLVLTNGGKLTWHPSHQSSTISISFVDVGANPCGGGATTIKILGIVTKSTSPAAPFFDRVSAEVCEASGTEDVSLLHGTTAKI